MASSGQIVIFGASARAAAFSASRAGLQPWCADLFADADLQASCPTICISPSCYPRSFVDISEKAPPGPWMYTGGLENHPALIKRIAGNRPLWGNSPASLSLARSPTTLASILRSNGIPFPRIHESSQHPPQQVRWLVKPVKGAGGTGIRFLSGTDRLSFQHGSVGTRNRYLQEYIEGLPWSAVYVGLEKGAKLLGTTRQLTGEAWLNAAAFHYCGSIGPLRLEPSVREKVERIGNVLAQECSLRGLFGVDFILSEGIPWAVEVNPRYPASTEILEYALGIKAMAFHRLAFDASVTEPAPVANAPGSETPFVGKAILFAKRPLEFPEKGPWTKSINRSLIEKMPDFADIPEPGRSIESGRPILTFFTQSSTIESCLEQLKQRARDLDHCLWKP